MSPDDKDDDFAAMFAATQSASPKARRPRVWMQMSTSMVLNVRYEMPRKPI